jgi:CRISPR/Cas system-associated exonuclease Cas4 (RecB family)
LYEIHSGTDKPVLVNDIEEIKKKIEETLKESYHETLKTGDIETGRNRIAFEVMRKFLENFFEKEKQRQGFRIEMLEKKIKAIDFSFPLKGETQHVLLEGTIDRLDKDSDGVYCIIDYKTGKTGSLNLNSEDFIMQLSGQEAVKRKEVFQLLFYRYLLKREGKYEGVYRLGIYPFKKMYDELVYVKADKVDIIEPGYVDGIEEILKEIFQELFDSEIPFSQTKEEKNCRLCPYVGICSKKIDKYIY